jgi:hypothetical protein
LRLWNNDILQNQDGVFRNIIEILESGQRYGLGRPPPQPSPVATGEGAPRSGGEGAGTNPANVSRGQGWPMVRERPL